MERIVVAGGGAFAPALCEALARAPGMPPLDVRLVARRAGRLAVIAAHAARIVSPIRPDFRVTAAASFDAALPGAAAVILMIRALGPRARDHDERFPRAFGLVGDEGLGPGGIANAFRTLPVLEGLAAAIHARAPAARVLNLVAPLGITTRLLLDAGLDAAGLCELPLVTLEAFARATAPVNAMSAPVSSPGDVGLHYAGLNHLGWFWQAGRGTEPDTETEPESETESESESESESVTGTGAIGRRVLDRAARAGLVDADVLARFGAAPLHYYYDVFDPAAARRLGRARDPGRARRLEALSDRLVAHYVEAPGAPAPAAAERPTPWLDRALAPALAALLAGAPHRGFANIRNGGLIPELPPDVVVELPAEIGPAGFRPHRPGAALPPAVARFLVAAARAEYLAYRAALARSPALVAGAIAALPLPIAPADVPALARLACAPVIE
ncbi:MAG: hypothetical protein IT372_21835 [Polyangiaceae bacterium]|nr:hypothetical protein [Polyangiaceae bacterium]